MPLTGTGISLNNARFGDVESYARAAASDGMNAYHFGRTQGYTLNVATGASTTSGTAYAGGGSIRAATYHNSQVLVLSDNRFIYVWTPGTGFAVTPTIGALAYESGSGFSGTPSINGFASHDGTLYVADSNTDHLFSVGTDGFLTAIGNGFGNINIGGMTSHDGQLLGTNNTGDRLVVFDTTDGTVSNVADNGLLGTRTVDFLLSHGGELYGGQFSDGLFRFYNVDWDDTVAGVSLDEGATQTWALGDISRDAASFEFDASSPDLAWLAISGTDLVATDAPQVSADTEYQPIINAIRAGVSAQLTHSVTVLDTTPPPPTLVATTLEVVSGDGQSAQVGNALSNPLVVHVLDQNNDPFSGATVNFATTGGTLSVASATTGTNGQASVTLTLPSTAGDYTVTASVTGLTDVTFTATATAVPPPPPLPTQTLTPTAILLKKISTAVTPAAAGDNNYATHTTQTTITVTLQNEAFDYIFLKMSGVTSYALELDGTSLGSRTVPANLTSIPELGDVSITRHGWQHDLYALSASQQGDSLEITFTGGSVRVSQVLVLKQLAEIKKLEGISHAKIDTDSETDETPIGYIENRNITGTDTLRWLSDYELEFTHEDDNWELFVDLIEDNIEGVVWAQEPNRKPWRVYEAFFSQDQYEAPYLSEYKFGGNRVQFQVQENRDVSQAWYELDTFNTNASGDGVMFFRDCAHLGQNGAVDDGDPDTVSTADTHTFSVDGVSHIYLKATGVDSYAIQVLVSGVWTTQETLTPTQKAYRGFQHSLSGLTTRRTETQVRVVLTGSSIEVNEILCLDHAGEILTDQQALLSKVFRKAVTQQRSRGSYIRTTVPGASRMKWALQMNNTFGHLDDFDSEDFFDWLSLHNNFVISYIPNTYPWRTFPCTTDRRFQNVFLTRILQNGDAVTCNILER